MKSLMIAGDRSGSGKTSITLGLAAMLGRNNIVQTFKVGMDYIDPSYLTAVTGRPCRNLDTWVMDERQVREIYDHGCRGANLSLVEGVRGLYEGAEALSDIGSTAGIAKALDLPVVLVVSARSITRSAAAIVKGFQSFDPAVRIRGVILNNVSGKKHIGKAVEAVEHYCGVPVVGAIPRNPDMELTMRHLGLVPYREGEGSGEFTKRVQDIAGMIGDHVDLDRLVSLAEDYTPGTDSPLFHPAEADVKIAVAHDEAFTFYYSDLFDVLPGLGAECVRFSPIHDRLPDADGYIIGGGYPEFFLEELEANENVRLEMRDIAGQGVPVYGECGGLMYLTDRIVLSAGFQDREKEGRGEMCGVFPGETRIPARRVVSYVEGTSDRACPMGQAAFRGHEFHYSDVLLGGDTRYAYRLSRGYGIRDSLDGAIRENAIGTYTHLHPVSSIGMFRNFVERCRKEKK